MIELDVRWDNISQNIFNFIPIISNPGEYDNFISYPIMYHFHQL